MKTHALAPFTAPTRVASILVCVLAAIALAGCGSKYAADKEMQALCAKDGGMKVYERVVLPASEFSRWVEQTEFLKRSDTLKGEVQMTRGIQQVYRRSDGKLLGESVEYGRSGGDPFISLLPGLHPSSSSCPAEQASLIQTRFTQGR